jgi:NAD-dependent DNA ligase
LKIEGFQKTNSEKIYNSIQNTIKQLSKDNKMCVDLMAATNLFGRNLGKKKIELIINVYPDYIRNDINIDISELLKIKGISTITANSFLEGIPKFHKLLKEIGITCSSGSPKKNKIANKIPSGENIVFTGFRNKEWEKQITDAGSSIKTAISKNITLVVANDINENSTKLQKAKELNILIISKDDFEKEYIV